jgi:hypothetical protein
MSVDGVTLPRRVSLRGAGSHSGVVRFLFRLVVAGVPVSRVWDDGVGAACGTLSGIIRGMVPKSLRAGCGSTPAVTLSRALSLPASRALDEMVALSPRVVS